VRESEGDEQGFARGDVGTEGEGVEEEGVEEGAHLGVWR